MTMMKRTKLLMKPLWILLSRKCGARATKGGIYINFVGQMGFSIGNCYQGHGGELLIVWLVGCIKLSILISQ